MADTEDSTALVVTATRPRRRSSYPMGENILPSSIVYIYAIGCADYVKVGIAADVKVRLSAIKTGNPFPVHIITKRWVPAARAAEAEHMAHDALAKFHHRDEWFQCSAQSARSAIRDATGAARNEFSQNMDAHSIREKAILAKQATDLLARSIWLRESAAEGRPIAVQTLAALQDMATGDFSLATTASGTLPRLTRISLTRSLGTARD